MSKPSIRSAGSDRRRFLRHLGATVGAAVGVIAVPRAGAHARVPSHDGDVEPQFCAVYCYMTSCPCPGAPAQTQFRCISQCGWEQTVCYQRSCVGFCLSQHAC